MIRDLLGTLDTGVLAQVGLIGFLAAFVAVLGYALTMRRDEREAAKQLPLQDPEEIEIHPN